MSWGRIDDGLHDNDKWVELSLAARGLWTTAYSWTCRHRKPVVTDGLLHMFAGGDASDLANEIVSVGMWHKPGHGCARCPEIDRGYVFHDWADYQERSVSEKRAEAGRKGGRAGRGEAKARRKQTDLLADRPDLLADSGPPGPPKSASNDASKSGDETGSDLGKDKQTRKQTASKRASRYPEPVPEPVIQPPPRPPADASTAARTDIAGGVASLLATRNAPTELTAAATRRVTDLANAGGWTAVEIVDRVFTIDGMALDSPRVQSRAKFLEKRLERLSGPSPSRRRAELDAAHEADRARLRDGPTASPEQVAHHADAVRQALGPRAAHRSQTDREKRT